MFSRRAKNEYVYLPHIWLIQNPFFDASFLLLLFFSNLNANSNLFLFNLIHNNKKIPAVKKSKTIRPQFTHRKNNPFRNRNIVLHMHNHRKQPATEAAKVCFLFHFFMHFYFYIYRQICKYAVKCAWFTIENC